MSKINDSFIDSQHNSKSKIWEKIINKFNIQQSQILSEFFKTIPLTYEYLFDFIKFSKNKDKKICMTALPKTFAEKHMKEDISKCIDYRNDSFKLFYVDYEFDENYNCVHGEEFKDVFLVFAVKNETEIIDLLNRFNKLKTFI